MLDKKDILDMLEMIRDKTDENATVERLISGIKFGLFDVSSLEDLEKKRKFISEIRNQQLSKSK